MKFSRIFRFLLLVLGLTVGLSAVGQRRKIQNKPFIDTRRWHYGFNIGFHDQGLHLVGNADFCSIVCCCLASIDFERFIILAAL